LKSKLNRYQASRSAIRPLTLVIALSSVAVPLSVFGGVSESIEGSVQNSGGELTDALRPASKRQTPPGLLQIKKSDTTLSDLKCWQKGKLIFHEIDWVPTTGIFSVMQSTTFTNKKTRYTKMHWIELGETFCIIRSI